MKTHNQIPEESNHAESHQPETPETAGHTPEPAGPTCEWPRWKGGDPADRWPAAQHWPLNR